MRKRGWKIAGLVVVALFGYVGFRFGPAAWDLYKGGYLFNEVKMREYQGTSKENLKALYTAMMLYHDSEDAFPPADRWMDAIQNYLRTGDLPAEEAAKKFRNPLIAHEGEDVYGYAMNEAFGGKYKDDVPNADSVPLLFDSRDTRRNAQGDPSDLAPKPPRPGGNLEVSVDGTVGPLD